MGEKAFRDPIHGFINIEDPLLLALVDTPEFQRLRRLRQLGTAFGTYHGAEHSRFGHSLGTLYVMTRILEHLVRIGISIDSQHWRTAQCAALLHDVGHGPFSHTLEGLLTRGRDHEEWSAEVLVGETAIGRILLDVDPGFPGLVAEMLRGDFPAAPFLVSLVSSQLDVDRMDYLLRDALFTGTLYGEYDLDRLIATLTVSDDRVVLVPKGISAAEEYVLARYYMYWQVYFHKTTRSQEVLLNQCWRRAARLAREGRLKADEVPPNLRPFLFGEVTLDAYLGIDDTDVWVALKGWASHPDPILCDLADRFLRRRLLKPVFREPNTDVRLERSVEAMEILSKGGWDPEYYFLVDRASDVAYDYYSESGDGATGGEGKPPILVMDETGRPRELSKLSDPIRAVASRRRVGQNIFVPDRCRDQVRAIFTQ